MQLTGKQALIYGGALVALGVVVGSYVGCRTSAVTALIPGRADTVSKIDTSYLPGKPYAVKGDPYVVQIYDTALLRVDTVRLIETKYVSRPSDPAPAIGTTLNVSSVLPFTNSVPSLAGDGNPQAYIGLGLKHDFIQGQWNGGLDLRAHIAGKFYIIADLGIAGKSPVGNVGVEYRLIDLY